ncbi:MAG TPA: oxygen-dependent coproporphyrinogen oxidase [Kofleriaceae bacterium]|nr:oxygen-dependent coproporphyrinogen oxidase [Kofleriaceae bacterium]
MSEGGIFERAAALFSTLQEEICAGLEELDGVGRFTADGWQREGGGGGLSRVLTGGRLFEKAGVNWSRVEGDLPAEFAAQIPGSGTAFSASGVSLVLHPGSPMMPTVHANFRFLEKGDKAWFGGGSDLTPYYLFRDDAIHFHRTWQAACTAHPDVADYRRFKSWCDEYFFLPHRGERRGVGGIFFDYLDGAGAGGLEAVLAFAAEAGRAFLPAYRPIAMRRAGEQYDERERQWQLVRRGRYVEFNLVYDRGTVFGLKTRGRTESVLMSLPPLVRWEYDPGDPAPGSREAELLEVLRNPVDWLDLGGSAEPSSNH